MPSYPFNAADELCAGAAQAAALCTLVIRGAQRGLLKAVPRALAAEHASTIRIKCGGWASPPCGGLAPVPPGHVASPDPRTVRGPDGAGGPGPLWGVRGLAVSSELPSLRDTWRLRTHPQAGNGSGAVGLVREEPDRRGLTTPSLRVVTDNYAGPVLLR